MDIRQIVKNLKIPLPEAEILLAHVLNKSREFIISHPETKTNKRQINKLNKAVNKRLNSVPLPYILGYKYFYGLKFLVNKSVLIPRPETELMVDEALKNITPSPQPITIMEVGTGSGCVIISIIKNLYLKSKTLSLKFFATDISRSALVVAKKKC